MSRVFIGVGGRMGGYEVYVEQDGKRQRLTRRVQRVHEGYSWDQAGPHSTELARAMLWLITGVEPPWVLYKGFTSDVVAHLPLPAPPCEGECWRLTEKEIRAWLHDVGWLTTSAGTQSERNERNLPNEGKAHNAQAQQTETHRRAISTWQEKLPGLPRCSGSELPLRMILDEKP